MTVMTSQLVVGDIVYIQVGDVLPADGILIQGFDIEADESTMTGEPLAVHKDLEQDPFLISGTRVMKGVGSMLVIATGVNSLHGRSMLALEVEAEDTPLQQKLGRLADFIAKFAIIGAIAIMLLLSALYLSVNNLAEIPATKIPTDLIKLFILAVTIIVVAVPEGLPLAVTLALAHATVQMLKDNNLVRNLASCETMGNATSICSDKTGTLTLNKMTVVQGVLLEQEFSRSDIPDGFLAKLNQGRNEQIVKKVLKLATTSLTINSSAGESVNSSGKVEMTGSKTEIAILDYLQLLGVDFRVDRKETQVVHIVPFSSETKQMTSVVKLPDDPELDKLMELESDGPREWIFVKGASEIVLKNCNHILMPDGKVRSMTKPDQQRLQGVIDQFADLALRTIGAAIRPVPYGDSYITPEGTINDKYDLILIGIFGIEDPLRPEVPDAVANCQSAGVVVRMVTGDSLPTARAIARGCGIFTNGLVVEGPEFRKWTTAEMDEKLPKLQVLARSSPLDKQILVKNLKRLGETVAVTGGLSF